MSSNVFYLGIYLWLEAAVIAKSNVILDVKPWDDETDLNQMEAKVRTISCDGLVWGVCQYSLSFDFYLKLIDLCLFFS